MELYILAMVWQHLILFHVSVRLLTESSQLRKQVCYYLVAEESAAQATNSAQA